MDNIKQYVQDNKERFINELIELLKIPSVSADTAYAHDVLATAEAVKNSLQNAGCHTVEICETPGYPIVYGEHIIDSNLPTVLVYGHYDVQPPDPIDLWISPPFEPVIKPTEIHPEGAIFARGACDDKGQMYMHIKAFEYMIKNNCLPCNVKFMIEESNEINAYAVASFRKKYVVITTSILKHILNSFETEEERKDALKGLIGHELSHLINWDFLPNLILISGENVSIHVQKFFSLFLNVLIVLFRIIPILGAFLSLITVYTYNFLSYFMTYSYKLLIRPTYNLFERFLSRRIEYRCDYQSAQALNWQSMYLILYSLLDRKSVV